MSLKHKLINYSKLSGSLLLLSHTVKSQVLHTDIDPDYYIGNRQHYKLDLNNDGIFDFRINVGKQGNDGGYDGDVELILYNNNSVVLSNNEAAVLNNGYLIGSSLKWANNNGYGINMVFRGMAGKWLGVTDKYLGLRFNVDGNKYFGWARLDVASDGKSVVVKEYAYNSVSYYGIYAGQTNFTPVFSSPATNLKVEDIAENRDGRDLFLSFNKASEETKVKKYRIIIVRNEIANTFNLSKAVSLVTGQYIEIKKGTDFNSALGYNARTSEGAFITENICYKLFVLSIPDGTIANVPAISEPSDTITLRDKNLYGIFNPSQNNNDFIVFQDENNFLHITLKNYPNTSSYLYIYNTLGVVIRQYEISNNTLVIDLNNLGVGFYFIQVVSDNKVCKSKILIK